MLEAQAITVDLGHRVLLAGASFQVRPGDRIGLVGRNGAGKTTLLRTLAGELNPAAGQVVRPKRLGWLPQELHDDSADAALTGLDHLLAAAPTASLEQELETLRARMESSTDDELVKVIERFATAEQEFASAGGYSAEADALRIAAGVGLDDEELLTELGALSGGQRRKVELARLLLGGHDILLLDEPTNHLDIEAKKWLMGFLAASPAGVLMVSHDLPLLDHAMTQVVALVDGIAEVHRGNYSQYKRVSAELEAAREKAARQFGAKVEQLRRTADRFRGGNETMARKAKVLDSRAQRLRAEASARGLDTRRRSSKTPVFKFPQPVRSGDRAMSVEGVSKSYDGVVVLAGVDVVVERGERLLIVGMNGAGKTTLLRVLAGVLEPDSGSVRLGANVTLGYYAQEHEDLDFEQAAFAHVRNLAGPDVSDAELRGVLGQFGISGEMAWQATGTFSGGEKTKLALARLVVGKANVLLLDEPTNNLDPQSRAAVIDALNQFEGTVIVVSHDAGFVAELDCDRAVVLPAGVVLPYDDDLLELVTVR